jgi:WS/DGAT/MGAT family acyltransferase
MSTHVGIADRIFLLQESAEIPQHVAALGTFTLPDDAPTAYLQRLVESFRAARTFAPPFNYRLRNPALKAIAPAFIELDDDQVDLDFHFRHSALPQPGGERELGILVSRLHSRALDPSKPLWEVHLIEGLDENRFALYLKIHHALMDGVGGARRLRRMLSPNPEEVEVRPFWTLGPSRRPPHAELQKRSPIDRVTGAASAVRHGLSTTAGLGRSAAGMIKDGIRPSDPAIATPYKVPSSPLNQRVGQQRRVATQAIDFERAHDVAHRAGVTLNDLLLAICAGALRRYLDELDALPEAGLVAGTPISVRVGDADDANNAFTIATMKLYSDIADPLERIRAIHRSSTLTKRKLDGLPKAVAENYGALFMGPFILQNLLGLGGRLKPPYNVIISNVPGPTETQYLAGSKLEAMYPFALLYHGMGLFIASLSISGKMGLGFIGDRDALPSLQRLAVYTGEALDELEAAVADAPAARRRSTAKPKS